MCLGDNKTDAGLGENKKKAETVQSCVEFIYLMAVKAETLLLLNQVGVLMFLSEWVILILLSVF